MYLDLFCEIRLTELQVKRASRGLTFGVGTGPHTPLVTAYFFPSFCDNKQDVRENRSKNSSRKVFYSLKMQPCVCGCVFFFLSLQVRQYRLVSLHKEREVGFFPRTPHLRKQRFCCNGFGKQFIHTNIFP